MSVSLSGLTWDHPRAAPPLRRTAAEHAARTGVTITWHVRSLYDFGMQPLDEVAREHDLIVLDHPHVGEACARGVLVPLDELLPEHVLASLADRFVGPSHASYAWDGRQWALPLDAAAQVAAWRPDLLAAPPASWSEVIALADRGRVVFAACSTDAFASFLTLAANRGIPCGRDPDELIDSAGGLAVLADLRELVDRVPRACLEMTPIDVLEALSRDDASAAYSPLLFGYSNYARDGFRDRIVRFADIPATGRHGCAGALLGGAGLAVSASSAHAEQAAAYVLEVCSGPAQAGAYLEAGGQPAHLDAWDDPDADTVAGGFFGDTRATMDRAWVRPRHPGWLAVQAAGMDLVHAVLTGDARPGDALAQMNAAWRASRPSRSRA